MKLQWKVHEDGSETARFGPLEFSIEWCELWVEVLNKRESYGGNYNRSLVGIYERRSSAKKRAQSIVDSLIKEVER